jgi:cytoskeletal protein CcmA (bactofilin family)
MFSKSTKPPARPLSRPGGPPPLSSADMQRAIPAGGMNMPAPAPVRPAASTSVIGNSLTLEGGVSGEGELQVDGLVRGDVRVGRVTVGESGQIEGSVIAEQVECRGRIIGSITAKQIRLFGTAHVDGDITHEQLAMETGAFFQGRSMKFQRPAAQGYSSPAPAHMAPQQGHAPQSQPQQGHPPMGDVISLGGHN